MPRGRLLFVQQEQLSSPRMIVRRSKSPVAIRPSVCSTVDPARPTVPSTTIRSPAWNCSYPDHAPCPGSLKKLLAAKGVQARDRLDRLSRRRYTLTQPKGELRLHTPNLASRDKCASNIC